MLSSRTPSQETSSPSPTTSSGSKEREENTDVQGGRISIYLHKREDQMSHDVIQPLLRSPVLSLSLTNVTLIESGTDKVRLLYTDHFKYIRIVT